MAVLAHWPPKIVIKVYLFLILYQSDLLWASGLMVANNAEVESYVSTAIHIEDTFTIVMLFVFPSLSLVWSPLPMPLEYALQCDMNFFSNSKKVLYISGHLYYNNVI